MVKGILNLNQLDIDFRIVPTDLLVILKQLLQNFKKESYFLSNLNFSSKCIQNSLENLKKTLQNFTKKNVNKLFHDFQH